MAVSARWALSRAALAPTLHHLDSGVGQRGGVGHAIAVCRQHGIGQPKLADLRRLGVACVLRFDGLPCGIERLVVDGELFRREDGILQRSPPPQLTSAFVSLG